MGFIESLSCALTNKWVVCIAILALVVYLAKQYSEEHFQMIDPLGDIVDLPTGIYSLSNTFGAVSSDSFSSIPLTSTNLVTHSAGGAPFSNQWAFKRVTDGVYLIRKPRDNLQGAECLYTGTDGSVRGYIVNDAKICGMETLNYENQLDPYSIRLYFKISKGPRNTVVIQSLENNMYMSYNGSQLRFVPSPDKGAFFTISQ